MRVLQVRVTDDVVILEGDIDMAVADDVRDAIEEAARSGARVVDLSGVTFMDSSGLRALLLTGKAMNGNGPLVLRDASRQVRRLFDVVIPEGAPGLEIRP